MQWKPAFHNEARRAFCYFMLVIAFVRLSPAHFFRRWSARGQWCHWMNVPTWAKCEDVTMQKQPRWKLHTGKTWRNVLHGHILSGRGGYKGGTGSMCHVSSWVDDGLAETWSKIAIMWILAWLRHAGCTQRKQPHQTWLGVAAGLKLQKGGGVRKELPPCVGRRLVFAHLNVA